MAWTILFLPRWLNCDGRKDVLVNQLREALAMLVPDQQPRWYKGTANLVYTYIVVSTITAICCLMFFTFSLDYRGTI